MNTKTLGNLEPSGNLDGTLHGIILFQNNKIDLTLYPDGHNIDLTIALAENTVLHLFKYDVMSKELACKEYLTIYNENWRDEQCPILTDVDFKNRIKLEALNFFGADGISFFYFDDNLFYGHSIVVESFDTLEFKNTTVNLWG
jgi:hypothetical protein